MKKLIFIKSLIFLITILITFHLEASYYGRFVSGVFISKEIFRNSEVDRYNDAAILSERLYVNFDKILGSDNEFIVDLRDKNNFFDKLNNERTKLIAKNKIQLHQFDIHKSLAGDGLDYSFGRFPISEAGALYLDGLDLGVKKSLFGFSTKFSLFYGLNPQIIEDPQIKIDKNLKAYGGYFTLEKNGKNENDYFLSTSSFVRQVYKSDLDRFYFFNNTFLQSVSGDNFSSILYLDLLPKTYIQNLWTTYVLSFQNKFKLRTSLSTIDSLHYSRIQDVRETLPSSRYNQASFSLRSPTSYNNNTYETKLILGMREIDKKKLAEFKFGVFFPRVINDEMSGTLNAGVRKNFVSNDLLLGLGLLHSNKFREISFSQDIQAEKRINQKINYAYITEGSYTKFFYRSLFGVFSLQNTWDNNVSIFSFFLKLSYRFGEAGQAPIRDGSPPMGQL